jgi:hypothetical protein
MSSLSGRGAEGSPTGAVSVRWGSDGAKQVKSSETQDSLPISRYEAG